MYNKFGGYGKGSNNLNSLSEAQMEMIEKTLPCPHNPEALSKLFLKGENKLKIEEKAARKSQHLLVLNNTKDSKFGRLHTLNSKTCFVEQEQSWAWILPTETV